MTIENHAHETLQLGLDDTPNPDRSQKIAIFRYSQSSFSPPASPLHLTSGKANWETGCGRVVPLAGMTSFSNVGARPRTGLLLGSVSHRTFNSPRLGWIGSRVAVVRARKVVVPPSTR